MSRGIQQWLCLAVLASAGTGALAGMVFFTLPPAPKSSDGLSSPIVSSSHRFSANGLSSAGNLSLVTWADQVAVKLEGVTALPLPFAKGEALRFSVKTDTNNTQGRIVKAQGWEAGLLSQKLVIINSSRTEQEDLLEGLCWLLLNRYVVNRQGSQQRETHLGTVPDWLSVGIAQHLYPSLRSRNIRAVLDRWRENEALPVRNVFQQEYLPDGRWIEKAVCALAVDWLTAWEQPDPFFEAVFNRLAENEPLTSEWFMQSGLVPAHREIELEKSWDLWIARQQLLGQDLRSLSFKSLADLKTALVIRPADYGVFSNEVPSVVSPERLIRLRDQPWVPRLATRVSLKIKSIGIGQSGDGQAVFHQFGRFFDRLAEQTAPRKGLKRLIGPPAVSVRELESLLANAEKALADLERTIAMQETYLGRIEQRDNGPAEELDHMTPHSEEERYLDEIERKQGNPALE